MRPASSSRFPRQPQYDQAPGLWALALRLAPVCGCLLAIACGGSDPGRDLCAGVICAAQDACHVAGSCAPETGACSNPAAGDGTACDDGSSDTVDDACTAGVC